MSTSPRTCAQNFLPNLTQSLANSRLALLHLYVPFTLQRIGQRDNSYRLPTASVRLRFPRFSCTKTAIYAGAAAVAVNHPHHTNHVNHSSNKCQPALANALIPVNPFHPPPKGLQPNPHSPAATTRAAFASRPSAVMRPKFLAQSHTISRKLSSNAPASLRAVDISKNRTKRQLLQAACGKNPTAIRPVLLHQARDLRRRRRRRR